MKTEFLSRQLGTECLIVEHVFDIGLGIVEVTVNSHHVGISPCLRGHLQFLDLRYPVTRIEDNDLCARNVRKPAMAALPVSPEVAVRMTISFSKPCFLVAVAIK